MKNNNREAAFIAGGTLLQLQREKGLGLPEVLISLEEIPVLAELDVKEESLHIGSGVTLSALQDRVTGGAWRILEEAVRGIAAPAVRNRATVGGNIAYKVGDLIPALLVLDTAAVVFDGTQTNSLPLQDYLSMLEPPLLVKLIIPVPANQSLHFYQKVGRREAFIPSLVTIAINCQLSQGAVNAIKLAAGGGSMLPERLFETEALISGARLDEAGLAAVHQQVQLEYAAAGDAFASTVYRKKVAANLVVSKLSQFL